VHVCSSSYAGKWAKSNQECVVWLALLRCILCHVHTCDDLHAYSSLVSYPASQAAARNQSHVCSAAGRTALLLSPARCRLWLAVQDQQALLRCCNDERGTATHLCAADVYRLGCLVSNPNRKHRVQCMALCILRAWLHPTSYVHQSWVSPYYSHIYLAFRLSGNSVAVGSSPFWVSFVLRLCHT
jgi:hypothetical protein